MDITSTIKKLKEPEFNLMVAKKYFEYQLRKYKNEEKAISAYNAGRAITTNKKYVARVLRQRQRLTSLMPLIRQNPNSFFGLFGLQFSKDIQHQLQNAIGFDAGNEGKCFR